MIKSFKYSIIDTEFNGIRLEKIPHKDTQIQMEEALSDHVY